MKDSEARRRLREAAMQGVVKATEGLRNEVIDLITLTPKTGKWYRIRGTWHRASAPGQAPASDTGKLVGSIRTKYYIRKLQGLVNCSVKYGGWLEFGTVRMAERPFMRPALANRREQIAQDINGEISKVLGP
jgi:HK97 gp10 family phage protein